ncbi:MAG: hypothetical protein ACP5QN_03245 [Minisyncoccia bacterium]
MKPEQKNISNPNSFEEISQNIETNPKNSWKRFLKFALAFLLIIGVVFGSVVVYEKYFNPEAQKDKEQQENYQKYLEWQASYKKAMTEDTYGGKTPEETLKLFIDALKKEDLELASKYFVLNSRGERDPKWLDALIKTKNAGKLPEVIEILSKAQPDYENISNPEDFKFKSYQNNKLKAYIDLEFNKYSNIWKIESL